MQQLIASGILIEEKAAQKLISIDNERLNCIISKIIDKKPQILTESVLMECLSKPLNILKELLMEKPKSMQEFVNMLNLKYSGLQKILIEKTDIKNIVSVKNIGSEYVTVICLVRKIKDGSEKTIAEMEDPTSSILVSLPKNDSSGRLRPDDVVAVSGRLVGSIFEADNVVWPDVPPRPLAKVAGTFVFLDGCVLDEKTLAAVRTADYVFVHDCKGWEAAAAASAGQWAVVGEKGGGSENIRAVGSPCILDAGGLVVLAYFGSELAADVLRRRCIDDFVVEPAPDIVFCAATEPANYKGITIISNGVVDAARREVRPL